MKPILIFKPNPSLQRKSKGCLFNRKTSTSDGNYDGISAFDHVLPQSIPYKGQVLNQIAAKFLDATSDICPIGKMPAQIPRLLLGKNASHTW